MLAFFLGACFLHKERKKARKLDSGGVANNPEKNEKLLDEKGRLDFHDYVTIASGKKHILRLNSRERPFYNMTFQFHDNKKRDPDKIGGENLGLQTKLLCFML